jgi:hypothetical protein
MTPNLAEHAQRVVTLACTKNVRVMKEALTVLEGVLDKQ